jgi:hypothetical protein
MKLNVTPAEHAEIDRMAWKCRTGPDCFNGARWVQWMKERFGVDLLPPGEVYELVVHRDVPGIPCGQLERLSDED